MAELKTKKSYDDVRDFIAGIADDIEEVAPLLANLGKLTTGKGCLYVKRLEDVDSTVLEELVGQSYAART